MNAETVYRLAADVTLLLHALFVAFVVVGLLLIVIGGLLGWQWVRNGWFRALHLVAIGIVVIQVWFGIICPLTTLEMWFRRRAGDATYPGSFIAHWLEKILYYSAPDWVFIVAYTGFCAIVVACWLLVKPNPVGGK